MKLCITPIKRTFKSLVAPGAPIKPRIALKRNIISIPKFDLESAFIADVIHFNKTPAASGNAYEKKVLNICRNVAFANSTVPLTTQTSTAGSSAGIDLSIDYQGIKVGVECKKSFAEGMQMSLHYYDGRWGSKGKAKIPDDAKRLFETNIGNMVLFGGQIPPFMHRDMTHQEWLQIKKAFADERFSCSGDLVAKMYRAKGCQYIQIGSHGLYHTGEDPCEFGVPYFGAELAYIRIRAKVHTRTNKKGNMMASVMASVIPNMRGIQKSPYSLDSFSSLPKNIIRCS